MWGGRGIPVKYLKMLVIVAPDEEVRAFMLSP
jgi:hypothetical protein